MDNSLKGLILAAGTIITCLVISLGFFIAKEAKASAAGGVTQISKLNAEFAESDKMIYEGSVVSGAEVISAIAKFKGDTVCIRVSTNKSTTDYHYTYDASSDSGKISGNSAYDYTLDQNNSLYINPTARFNGNIVRNKNGSICLINFTQQK